MTDTAMPTVAAANEAMAAAWNGEDGAHWVAHAERYDRSLARYQPHLLDAAAIRETDRVLDIGCGSGRTTRDAARLAAQGEAVGVDVSGVLVENARRLAEAEDVRNATFVHADAQVHPFEAGAFDVGISRTGVMFFADAPAAFANIGRAIRPGGRLALLVWQSPAENEWVSAFMSVLLAGRTPPPPPAPDAPSPFSLADPARVRSVLGTAGFTDIALEDVRHPMDFGDDVDDAFAFVSTLGMTRGMLTDLDEDARAAALVSLRDELANHATADGVHYRSAVWIITARRLD